MFGFFFFFYFSMFNILSPNSFVRLCLQYASVLKSDLTECKVLSYTSEWCNTCRQPEVHVQLQCNISFNISHAQDSTKVYQGRLCSRSEPLLFYIPFLTEKVILSQKMAFHSRTCSRDTVSLFYNLGLKGNSWLDQPLGASVRNK